jgi:lipopolysaccharide assembly outer membrane protein LptD (OstA)
MKTKLSAYAFILLSIYPMIVFADSAPTNIQGDGNVKIIADSIECDQIKNICVATGNAFIEKLNVPDKRTIQADSITMVFEKNPDNHPADKKDEGMPGGQKPKDFHAEGNVLVTIKDSIIRGDQANYDPNTEVAEVHENVSVTSGRNEILGNYGRANLKTGEYQVINSSGRVTALVFQDNKK